MTKINNTQYVEGRDFFHRAAWTPFRSVNSDNYSGVTARGLDSINNPGRESVVDSSHIFYNYLPRR